MQNSEYPIYHYSIEQNSDEWDEIRTGKITGSKASLLKAKGKNEFELGTGAITYAYKLAAERFTGWKNETDSFKSEAMQRGHDLEPVIIECYEELEYIKIKNVGFVQYSDFVGCSPDGLVGDNGLIEMKTRDNHLYMKTVREEVIPIIDIWQVQFNLLVTGRQWCDYLVYNLAFKNNTMWKRRIERDEEIIETIRLKIKSMNIYIDLIIDDFKESFLPPKNQLHVLNNPNFSTNKLSN